MTPERNSGLKPQITKKLKEAVLNHTHGKPVIWAEPADSPNAGAVGDSVELLKAIPDRKPDIKPPPP